MIWFIVRVELDGELFSTLRVHAVDELQANSKAREYVKWCHPVLTDPDLRTSVCMD